MADDKEKQTVEVATEDGPRMVPMETWCPACGPDVRVDEDGCCASCGADAVGEGVNQAHRHRREIAEADRFWYETLARIMWRWPGGGVAHCANRKTAVHQVGPLVVTMEVRDTREPDGYSREEVLGMLRTVRAAEKRMEWRCPDDDAYPDEPGLLAQVNEQGVALLAALEVFEKYDKHWREELEASSHLKDPAAWEIWRANTDQPTFAEMQGGLLVALELVRKALRL